MSYHESKLLITTRKQRLQQAKAIVKAGVANSSLAEQLLKERRAEADTKPVVLDASLEKILLR